MKELLTKPLRDIDASDIERLIEAQEEESLILELKGPLPVEKGREDPWAAAKGKISNHTRDEVLAEVVGMLNAAGGLVILGIDETDDDPRRADKPHPLRDCMQLADRFEDKAWSCIDPRLPNLDVKGVPIEGGSGEGFVVFRVPSLSPRGPFGLSTKHRAFVRRGSKTEPMLVSEIRDHTLQLRNQTQLLEARLKERQEAFHRWWPEGSRPCSAIRATVIPTAEVVSADAPYARETLWPDDIDHPRSILVGCDKTELILPRLFNVSRVAQPILRGATRVFTDGGDERLKHQIFWDGLTEIWARTIDWRRQSGSTDPFYVNHVLGAAYEAIRFARLVARHGGAPGVELLLEIELADSENELVQLCLWNNQVLPEAVPLPWILPQQGVPHGDLSVLLTALLDDLLNAAGARSMGGVSLAP